MKVDKEDHVAALQMSSIDTLFHNAAEVAALCVE